MGIDLLNGGVVLDLEIIRFGGRWNEAVVVAACLATIHHAQAVGNTESGAAFEIIRDRRHPGFVLSTIVRSIKIGHQLDSYCVMVDVVPGEVLTSAYVHDAGYDSRCDRELPAVSDIG